MLIKEYNPVIYPFKLVIASGMSYEYMSGRYENLSADGWGEEREFDTKAATVNFVGDKEDKKQKVLLNAIENLSMRDICHETFHVAIEYCKELNMSIGFEIGQDEHPAYIAGWAGSCMDDFIKELEASKAKESESE